MVSAPWLQFADNTLPSLTLVTVVVENPRASWSWQVMLLQRSGIKEEGLALGQHGGQPRS
jgi:hypothetical protein